MGDPAEDVFEAALPLGKCERVGFRRPNVTMGNMSEFLRHTPDFYTETGWLVEVMGVGRDDLIKLKQSKHDALRQWHTKQRLVMFVWNSHRKHWLLAPMDAVNRAVARVKRRGETTAFPNDGNVYYPLAWDELIADKDVSNARA